MATSVKCEKCGRDIRVAEGATSGTCEHCGTTVVFEKTEVAPTAAAAAVEPLPEVAPAATVAAVEPLPMIVPTVVVSAIEPLLERGKLFLEDGEWEQADGYFNRVLDMNPKYAPAYVGRLCVELKVREEELLVSNKKPLTEYNHYQKAVRFADTVYRAKLEGYNKIIMDRIAEEQRQEQERVKIEERQERIEEDDTKSYDTYENADYELQSSLPPPPPPKLPPKQKIGNPIIYVAAIIGLILCAIVIYFLARPSVETLFNKGKEQFEAEKFTEAVTYFSKAIKRKSDNAEIFGWRGKAYYELKNYKATVADFKEAARLAPKMAENHYRLGEVYSDSAVKNYDDAITAYTQAIKLDSNNANYYFCRAKAHSYQKRYRDATGDFTQAIRLNPRDARYWNGRGGDYRNMGDYDKAYADYSEAIRLNSSDAMYHNNSGLVQVLRKNYAEAIPFFSEAIRLAPDSARYYNSRGDAYLLTKEVALAAADYRMAVKLDQTNDTYRKNSERIGQMLSEQEEPTDPRDGQKYRTVKIGDKTWLAQNMNYRPQDGNSWCYDNNSSNCEKYGRLYDWNTAKKVCPAGWHLSTRKEWKELIAAAGASSTAGKKLKITSPAWNGTNDYNFSALPGGYRNNDGSFGALGTDGSWWTATESGSRNAYLQYMGSDYEEVLEVEYEKSNGLSVRCVMDAR